MKPHGKRKKSNKKSVPKTRKALRKEQRQAKKAKKGEYFSQKKNKPINHVSNERSTNKHKERLEVTHVKKSVEKPIKTPDQLAFETEQKAAAKMRRHEKQVRRVRVKQLKEANVEEDKIIKRLEKDLKIRKSKSAPKSFALDGLDDLLNFCDQDKRAEFAAAEYKMHDSDSEFGEDFAVITGKQSVTEKEQSKDSEDGPRSKKHKFVEAFDTEDVVEEGSKKKKRKKDVSKNVETEVKSTKLKKKVVKENAAKTSKKKKSQDVLSDDESFNEQDWEDDFIGEDKNELEEEEKLKGAEAAEEEVEEWEDIYGRRRAKTGEVLPAAKYVPPHLRAGSAANTRLHAQLKGLLNRLSENNMKKIADELESLYMSNSRHDTSETLTRLLMESLIAEHSITPDRLVAEHVMLVAILHANVGTEVGAHLLQALVTRFSNDSLLSPPVEDKRLDNLVLAIAHLYNFRVFASELVYDILAQLAEKFSEKEVGLILLVLKTVGASLRRDNPVLLKDLITRLQTQAGRVADLGSKDNTRVRFLLDVVLAIKNNNMSKIPGYDVAHVDHLKKTVKVFLRPGNSVTELKISLQDLLKAETQGRWWVVGSAWLGNEVKPADTSSASTRTTNFSAQVLALARKQRMNTEVRRNVFCIVMTAEDYLDAFEKLLHLGLKNQQQREIVHVLLDCCLQEKQFNAYYAHLASKFCSFDRKYQLAVQYLLWDKLKEVDSLSKSQTTNLAKFLSHLFLEPQGLPLSVLKVIHFAEVDKPTVRLLRQALLGLLLADSEEACCAAFTRIAGVEKLRQFREGLRLFLHHFVLRQTKQMQPDDVEKLRQRTKMADQALCLSDGNMLF